MMRRSDVADGEIARLIGRCARGDAAALRVLYDSQAAFLLGIAVRLLGDRPLAEEVVQDAFVQVWRHADRFDDALGSPRAWLAGIVRYRALDRRTAERRHVHAGDVELSTAEDKQLLDGLPPAAVEERASLARCLGELQEGPRRSILLAYIEGCSHSEIAERLDQPLGTVKSWIVRGLEMLKRCLSDDRR